jgi:AcrR family transcriptional regulator
MLCFMPKPPAAAPSRRRRSRKESAGPRDRLLVVADDLFYRRGIRNVGIDEIIATAGVARASLYSHFASKDELVAEYVRRRADSWWKWFQESVEVRATAPARRLLAAFDVLGEWLATDDFRGCALQNACVELADAAHAGHLVAQANKSALRGYLAQLAAAAGARDPRALAEQLALLMEGAIVTALVEGSSAPARTARAAAAVLVRAH